MKFSNSHRIHQEDQIQIKPEMALATTQDGGLEALSSLLCHNTAFGCLVGIGHQTQVLYKNIHSSK